MKWKTWTAAAAVWMAVSSCLCGCSSTSLKDYERYTYDLTEYVQLGQYKGVTIQDYEMHTVTDADVQQQVLVARSNYAEVRRKTDGAAQNDQLNIDFVGYLDGEEFEGGSASDFDVTIGSGQMLDGFESGLVGVKPGETVTLHLVYPDPYPLDTTLSGKSVQFVVTVNTVNEQILPEYTDAFVKEYYGYDTVAAFEQALCDELIEREETNRENYRMNQVWEAVTAQSEVLQYPETECGELYESYISYYTSVAQEQEMS